MNHFITIEQLISLLQQLYPTDVLVPNDVHNLAIYREGSYIGYVDFNENAQQLELDEESNGRPTIHS